MVKLNKLIRALTYEVRALSSSLLPRSSSAQ